jgi:hypothetical protein
MTSTTTAPAPLTRDHAGQLFGQTMGLSVALLFAFGTLLGLAVAPTVVVNITHPMIAFAAAHVDR